MSDDWTPVVREVARQLGLAMDVDEDDEDDDGDVRAEGEIGGLFVELSLEEVAMIRVDTHGDDALWLRRKGSRFPFGGGTPHRFDFRDPEFDHYLEVGGCSASIRHVLRYDVGFRRSVHCVIGELGATFKEGSLIWTGPPPATAQQVRAILDPMLELGRRLKQPRALHQLPAVGTATAAWLRGLSNAPEDDYRLHLVRLFEHITPHLGHGQAYVDHNEGLVEWQGHVHGLATRIQVGSDWDVSIEVRTDRNRGHVTLHNDPEMVPATDAPPPWYGKGESLVFVGPGVYLRGDSAQADAHAFEALPRDVKAHIVTAMTRDRLSSLSFGDGIRASFEDEIQRMLDPEGQLARTAQLCAWLAPHASALAPQRDEDAHRGVEPSPLTCKYCSTLFVLVAHDHCPNCGAPPTA